MPQPSSSISNSDASSARADAWRTAAWFVAFLGLFEIGTSVALAYTPIGGTAIGTYFWYGESYEGKLRRLVHTPDLPSNSILYVGWLDREDLEKLPDDVDLTIYGSSFAADTAQRIRELRPSFGVRMVGAPGCPLNHAYGLYEIDRSMRKTRAAVIGLVSLATAEVLLMNRGTVYGDAAFPFFSPRYDVVDGKLERVGNSRVNSASELTRAIDDPKAWGEQREVLARYDDGYRSWLFDADLADQSTIARLVRRGLSKQHQTSYVNSVYTSSRGFNREHRATEVFRALLRQFIVDLRAEGVQPIVVIYDTLGYGKHLDELVNDILLDEQVPLITSADICPASDASHYVPDGHFTLVCNVAIAKETLEVVDRALSAKPLR